MSRLFVAVAILVQLCPLSRIGRSQQRLPESYTLSRDQIVAIHELSRDQGRLTFVWDWKPNDPWEWHGDAESETAPTEGILYEFDGHSWYTTEHTLKALTAFPETAHVNLAYCFRCSDAGISHLKELKSLKTLVLYRNAARYAGNFPFPMKNPEQIKQLLTDQAIEHIADFPALEALHLGDNQFSEAALLKLGRLKSLKLLSLDDSQLSSNGRSELETMLPNCTIDIWPGRKAGKATEAPK